MEPLKALEKELTDLNHDIMMVDSKLKNPKFASGNPFFPKIHKDLKSKNLKEKKLNLKIKELLQEIEIEKVKSSKLESKKIVKKNDDISSSSPLTNKTENMMLYTAPSVVSQETLKNGENSKNYYESQMDDVTRECRNVIRAAKEEL